MRFFTVAKASTVAALGLLLLTFTPSTAGATSLIDDPLHGFCGTSWATSSCSSQSNFQGGAITPFSNLTTFGFISDPNDVVGFNYLIAILVPDTLSAQNFVLNEVLNGNPVNSNVSAVSKGDWASGNTKLDDFLGLTNTNPTSSFSGLGGPASTAFGSTVTGFDVYLATFSGPTTLYNQNNSTSANTPLFSLASGSDQFSQGMEIVGFLVAYDIDNKGNYILDKDGNKTIVTIGTPPGSVLLDVNNCIDCGGHGAETAVPEPASLLLFGTGLGVLARRVRRRKRT